SATSPIGTYTIAAAAGTLSATNYTLAFSDGILTIDKVALTVAAADATKIYGAGNPTFTGTIVGVQNSDNITATYASGATAASPVGTYAIIPTLLDPDSR